MSIANELLYADICTSYMRNWVLVRKAASTSYEFPNGKAKLFRAKKQKIYALLFLRKALLSGAVGC